jgi:hypothetical protein
MKSNHKNIEFYSKLNANLSPDHMKYKLPQVNRSSKISGDIKNNSLSLSCSSVK